MANKIRATIKRTEVANIINQMIELSMVDTDDEDQEQHICTIHVDEIEIPADFIEGLYNDLVDHRNKREEKDVSK